MDEWFTDREDVVNLDVSVVDTNRASDEETVLKGRESNQTPERVPQTGCLEKVKLY